MRNSTILHTKLLLQIAFEKESCSRAPAALLIILAIGPPHFGERRRDFSWEWHSIEMQNVSSFETLWSLLICFNASAESVFCGEKQKKTLDTSQCARGECTRLFEFKFQTLTCVSSIFFHRRTRKASWISLSIRNAASVVARDLSRTTDGYVERVTSVTNGIIMPSTSALLGRCVPRDAGTN